MEAKPKPRGICRHCRQCRVSRPGGLCWTCYYTPGVRERYTYQSKFAKRPQSNSVKPAAFPTSALPGSAVKIWIMAHRLEMGQALHHPGDAKGSVVGNERRYGGHHNGDSGGRLPRSAA